MINIQELKKKEESYDINDGYCTRSAFDKLNIVTHRSQKGLQDIEWQDLTHLNSEVERVMNKYNGSYKSLSSQKLHLDKLAQNGSLYRGINIDKSNLQFGFQKIFSKNLNDNSLSMNCNKNNSTCCVDCNVKSDSSKYSAISKIIDSQRENNFQFKNTNSSKIINETNKNFILEKILRKNDENRKFVKTTDFNKKEEHSNYEFNLKDKKNILNSISNNEIKMISIDFDDKEIDRPSRKFCLNEKSDSNDENFSEHYLSSDRLSEKLEKSSRNSTDFESDFEMNGKAKKCYSSIQIISSIKGCNITSNQEISKFKKKISNIQHEMNKIRRKFKFLNEKEIELRNNYIKLTTKMKKRGLQPEKSIFSDFSLEDMEDKAIETLCKFLNFKNAGKQI